MKKILYTFLAITLAVSFTSCLKDKAFEDKKIGLDGIGETTPMSVGIPEASGPITFRAYEVKSTPIDDEKFLFINLNSAEPAKEDVSVNLALNNTLIANYNSANGTNLVPLPGNQYTFTSTLKVVIPRGSNNGYLKIRFPATTGLNAQFNYAFGFTIASVDQPGYVIAANQRDIVVQINVKNKYDGVWSLNGRHNRPTLDGPYRNINVLLITSGERSAYMRWPGSAGNFIYQGNAISFNGPNVDGHPIATSAGALSYYGSFTVNYIFNPADNFIDWNMSPYANTLTNQILPPPAFTNQYFPPAGGQPARILAHFQYNGNPARQFYDTLTYVCPRP